VWRVVALLLVVSAGSTGCDGVSPYTVIGEQAAIADGQAFTWANMNSDSQVREFGLTIPLQVLPALQDGFSLTLALPEEVQGATSLRSVMLELGQQRAFLPPLYRVPRLDVRFFTASRAELELVDCRAEPMPAAGELPAPYSIESTRAEPEGSCVPRVGVHAVDRTAPELEPMNRLTFKHALLLGYHSGKLFFLLPTITMATVQQGGGFEAAVPRPEHLPAGVLWPSNTLVGPDIYETVISFSMGRLRVQ
jgi:hypothetical protein